MRKKPKKNKNQLTSQLHRPRCSLRKAGLRTGSLSCELCAKQVSPFLRRCACIIKLRRSWVSSSRDHGLHCLIQNAPNLSSSQPTLSIVMALRLLVLLPSSALTLSRSTCFPFRSFLLLPCCLRRKTDHYFSH